MCNGKLLPVLLLSMLALPQSQSRSLNGVKHRACTEQLEAASCVSETTSIKKDAIESSDHVKTTPTEAQPVRTPAWRRPEWLSVIASGLSAFISLGALFAIVWQAVLLRRQIVSTECNSAKQLRAYVCLDSATVKFTEPGVPEAQVQFRNCGQTPAYKVSGWIGAQFATHPLSDELPAPSSEFTMGVEPIAPNRITVFIAPAPPPLRTPFLRHLGTPACTLYIYGELHYMDTFGKNHITRYRLIYGGKEGVRKAPQREGRSGEYCLLSPDSAGNEIT